jgi:hypothetical protein
VGYASSKGRKPIERASKISHTEIINSSAAQDFLKRCALRKKPASTALTEMAVTIPKGEGSSIQAVIAIDGGYTEVAIDKEFPSSAIAFFSFGPLLLRLEDLLKLDSERFIFPEDIAALKNIQRYPPLVLPIRNVHLQGAMTLSLSIRRTIFEYLTKPQEPGEPTLADALRWLIFGGWSDGMARWTVRNCPNRPCVGQDFEFTSASGNEEICPSCGQPIFISDVLRLHEAVDEEQGASGILGYLMTTLEQLVLVQLIMRIQRLKSDVLRQVLFIKDGPLAFFGQTAPLVRPMRELTAFFLGKRSRKTGSSSSLLKLIGLEKSGPFVEHAAQIENEMKPGTAIILTNDYIYKYIVPGNPAVQQYGNNTYYGAKAIYKTEDGSMYVVTMPVGSYLSNPTFGDIPSVTEVLSIIGSLRCSMYENALVPVALANKLVSLSEFPSQKILQVFAQRSIG